MVKSVRLKSVLRNFLNHFETLESRHRLSVESNDHSIDLYRKEFQTLKDLTESLKTDPNCGSVEGENDVNRRKNRYKDILPYDHSRVIMSEFPGIPGSDYMNANYVRGSSGCPHAYIASQGPLPNTVVDFWRMIWETDVTVIVMACNERESGKYKCESYWPEDNAEPQQYGNITVELVKWRQVCPDFLVRTLKARADSTTERTICQFHYTTWPDHGVPNSVHPILELVRLMRDVQISETRPILVHCSAGCGRTGTICSIDYVWALLRTGKLREDFSLYNIINDMRRQRIAMVQTLEQYMLCYRAVATLFEQQMKIIDSHTYENIDGDGEPLMRRQLLPDLHNSAHIEDNRKLEQRNGGNDKHLKICEINSPSNTGDEVRHERLVGKATVIRRPSIAKLKAIFENQNPISTEVPIVRSRSTSASLNRTQSIKEMTRNTKSMIETNNGFIDNNLRNDLLTDSSEQNFRQKQSESQTLCAPNGCQQPINAEFNPLVHKIDNCFNNSQTFESNSRQILQINPLNGSQVEPFSLTNEQKLLHQNHQQLQQEMRQHLQQKQFQSMPSNQSIPQSMASNSYRIPSQMQTPIQSQMSAQMGLPLQMPITMNGHIQSQPLPAPPKPPRTYQYHNIIDSAITSLPNASEGRLIVSVALPRRPTNDSHYEPIGQRRCNISAPNLVSDALLVNANNIENFNNFNINTNNGIKVMNVSNNNIYETVLTKYRTSQPLEPSGPTVPSVANPSQNHPNIHSYYDIMKLRNPGLNSTLPFYDSIYGRHGFMTVPNLRHIPVPALAQVQCYPQFKHNFETIYSNTNPNNNNNNNLNINKNKTESNKTSNSDRIANNFVENIEKPENVKNINQLNKKVKNSDKKDRNSSNNSKIKSNQKNELKNSANNGYNGQSVGQDSNSGTFSKLSNAFKGLRIKSTKTKTKANANITNSPTNNSVNGPTVSRPPHSHRFSPPTQWTQV